MGLYEAQLRYRVITPSGNRKQDWIVTGRLFCHIQVVSSLISFACYLTCSLWTLNLMVGHQTCSHLFSKLNSSTTILTSVRRRNAICHTNRKRNNRISDMAVCHFVYTWVLCRTRLQHTRSLLFLFAAMVRVSVRLSIPLDIPPASSWLLSQASIAIYPVKTSLHRVLFRAFRSSNFLHVVTKARHV